MKRALIGSGVAVLFALVAFPQRGRYSELSSEDNPAIAAREAEFHFIRVEYTDLPQYHRGFGYASRDGQGTGWWIVDWPDADNHFTRGIQRLTKIDVGDPRHMRLTDDRIFDYPWIYATQTGWWGLSDRETTRLREYLMRGGFLVTDDMWGADAWDVPRDHAARPARTRHPGPGGIRTQSCTCCMTSAIRIALSFPGSRHLWRRSDTVEVVQPPGSSPAWRSIYDDHNHMVVSVNYDTDIGDAWEFADVPYYPEAMTALAYRYGINYIVYAMTH